VICLYAVAIFALAVLAAFCALGLDDTHYDVTHRGNR
jgi:hypothetical protein